MNENEQISKYKTKESVDQRAHEAIGVKFKDYPNFDGFNTGKGAIGQVVEKYWFNLPNNSRPEPDFKDAGVELKVTGYLKRNNNYKAKERLVLNIINYMNETNMFDKSSFWLKNKLLELMFYEYRLDDSDKNNWEISAALLFTFPKNDLIIIKQDFEYILSKIKSGKAHELSEGDTLYLGACCKGVDSKDLVNQPESDIKAMRRAYCLKVGYMTEIINNYVFSPEAIGHTTCRNINSIIKNCDDLLNTSFEDYIKNKLEPYKGKTIDELKSIFNLESCTNKSVISTIVSRMLDLRCRINDADEIKKANIKVKTIRLNENNTINESMSFPCFDPNELIKQEWEDSDLYETLACNKFMFIIFKEYQNTLVFYDIKLWNMPYQDLEEVKKVWLKTKEIFETGTLIIENKNNKNINNLPKPSESPICHVRPHARNAEDTILTPQGTFLTKQCFWLLNKYIEKIIK